MGWGSIKKAVKKAGKQIGSGATKVYKEYDRYTSSKWGAYLTPYLSMYDSDGRMALRQAYGNYVAAGASMYNPAAGQAISTGLAAYDAHNAPKPSGFTAPEVAGPVTATPMDSGDNARLFLIGGSVVVALAVAAIIVLKKRRK